MYIKALNEIQKLRLHDSQFVNNQGLLSLQITLMNFISSLATQHTDIASSLNDDILCDLIRNHSIQKSYRSHYVIWNC